MTTIKESKKLAEALLKTSNDFKLNQIGYHLTKEKFSIWTMDNPTFHNCDLITMFESAGFNCYVQFDVVMERCELIVF